jgi:hypothetical protein
MTGLCYIRLLIITLYCYAIIKEEHIIKLYTDKSETLFLSVTKFSPYYHHKK